MGKLVFLNIGWMTEYKGLKNDNIAGGGKHIEQHGWGGEIYNFLELNGKYYGYAEVRGNINLSRIDNKKKGDFLDDITIVWTAKRKNVGTVVIGWYKNAKLHSSVQNEPKGKSRSFAGNAIGFIAEAERSNSVLLDIDKRVLRVPRGKNGMGQRNVWYADSNPEFVKQVKKFITTGDIPKPGSGPRPTTPRQPDPLKRIEVEKKAILLVTKHYTDQGYEVTSFEKDNVGWDLTAKYGTIEIKLEVKGLSGSLIATELTPNEYKNLKKYIDSYRLCVVSEALDNDPRLKIFSYSPDRSCWIDGEDNVLLFEDVTSAKITI